MLVTMVGLAVLTRIQADSGLLFILACLATLGFGFALFSSPNMNAIMGSVPRRYYGIASGLTATMRQLGMMFSMGIAVVLFVIFLGRVKISPEVQVPFLDSVKWAFGVFAVLCFGGIFASLARGRLHVNSEDNAQG
jgi:MFS family permease